MSNENYIAGYMKVSKQMMQPFQSLTPEGVINDLIAATIPIYTRKKPNPKSGKKDCPITKREKERFRVLMKKKLMAAKTEEERQKVIDHYKDMWSETGS